MKLAVLLLKDNNRAANRIRISQTGDCGIHEQGVYASRKLGAERKVMISLCKN